MIRPLPFNLKENAEKGQEMLGKVLEAIVDHSFNPLDKVGGMIFPFRVDVSKAAIQVTVHEGGRLKIRAERDDTDFADAKFLCRERKKGVFERVFFVDDIEENGITLSYENGILHVIVPKLEETSSCRVFTVQ